jgi:hypothetical protein
MEPIIQNDPNDDDDFNLRWALDMVEKEKGGNMHYISEGDSVVIYFMREDSAPYRLHGTFLSQDDEYVVIEGTVGEYIGRRYWIPKNQIKMIENSMPSSTNG